VAPIQVVDRGPSNIYSDECIFWSGYLRSPLSSVHDFWVSQGVSLRPGQSAIYNSLMFNVMRADTCYRRTGGVSGQKTGLVYLMMKSGDLKIALGPLKQYMPVLSSIRKTIW